MLIHLWELITLLTGDYGAMVMAAIQVFLIIIIISTEDPKETHDMPYVPKRKRPPRNEILACTNRLINIFLMCLDTWINTGTKQSQKQYCKWKIRNNKQKSHVARHGSQRSIATCTQCRHTLEIIYEGLHLIRTHSLSCLMMEHLLPSPMIYRILRQNQYQLHERSKG